MTKEKKEVQSNQKLSPEEIQSIQESPPRGIRIIQESKETSNFVGAIEKMASNPDINVVKLEKIIDMQERILDRNAKQAFNAAMTRAQNRIKLVVAKSKNDQTHSNYAKLGDILRTTKPVYTEEGFGLMFYEEDSPKENHIRVAVDVMHTDGYTLTRHVDVAVQTKGIAGKPMMTQIHGEGSAFSYGRRYLTCLIFNIPIGDDDDGNAAGVEYISENQLAEIASLIDERDVNIKKFLAYIKAESLETILAKDFNTVKTALESKKVVTGKENG